jgi:cytochrome c-type biogenesis protein CcmH/NrfF
MIAMQKLSPTLKTTINRLSHQAGQNYARALSMQLMVCVTDMVGKGASTDQVLQYVSERISVSDRPL